MVKAQRDTVVWMSGASVGELDDVMDFAPRGGNVAARDDAASVAKHDRSALVGVEYALRRPEPHDAAATVHDHSLDAADATNVSNGRERNWLTDAVGISVPTIRRQVFLPH